MQPLVIILKVKEEEDWWCITIFQTHVACQGRLSTIIFDGGSSLNIASQVFVEKLCLKIKKYPNPYQVAWIDDTSILVSSHCVVMISFGNNFELSKWCDVLPMKFIHIML